MPGQISKFAAAPTAPSTSKKYVIPIRDIPEQGEKRWYRRCWIGVLTGICLTVGIILAGVLPALIVTLTRSSTANASANDVNGNTNTGATSVGTFNGTTAITSNPATSSLSMSSSGSTLSVAVNNLTSISAIGFTAGGAVASGTTAWYGFEEVSISCSVDLINITIIITVQKTVNATYRGAANTFWSGVMIDTYIDTGSQIIYIWTINNGQTVQSNGSPYIVEAQFYLSGINQTTSADTYEVTATTVTGLTNTISGTF